MNPLIEFIKSNEDWKTKLTEEPYNLSIKGNDELSNLFIFKYNQIKSDMTLPIVQESRGIIVDIEDPVNPFVVCYPFSKFFNYNDGRAHKIDWKTARVIEKVDGSIIKLYNYNKRWHIATNGCINAYETDLPMKGPNGLDSFGKVVAIGLQEQNVKLEEWNPEYTYIFELTSPYNRVVVPHSEISVTHLGTRHNDTGEEVTVYIGVKKPKDYSFSSFEDAVSSSEVLPFDDEGYVVVDAQWNRVKVKSLAYLQVHHLADNGVVSKKRMLKLIISGEDGELLKYYPEYTEIFEEVRAVWTEHLDVLLDIEFHAIKWSEKYPESDKAYAMQVINNTSKAMHPYFFALKKNNVSMLEKLRNNLTDENLLNRKDHIIKEK
jgi:T4 RnlA family RNA ligase